MPEAGVVLDEFKQRRCAVWDAADYAELSHHIKGMGERVVAAPGVEPGMDSGAPWRTSATSIASGR